MKNTKIKQYNPEAFKIIDKFLDFSEYRFSPVKGTFNNANFEEIGIDLITILSAIETIGYTGVERDIGLCAGLAGIAKKMIPTNELEFLDSLLIPKKNQADFKTI